VPLSQVGKEAGHRFPGSANHLGNLIVREHQPNVRLDLRGLTVAGTPFQQQLGQLLFRRVREPKEWSSWHALLYLTLSCSTTLKQASGFSFKKRSKSSRFTKPTWQGSIVSAVKS
jgi:hypothetical protein